MVLDGTSYSRRGAIESIVLEFQQRGFSKAAAITDKGLIEHGIATKVARLLDNAAIDHILYDKTIPNPTIQNVKDGVAFIKETETDCLIVIGGGSPINTAGVIGIILTNPEFSDVISLGGATGTKNPRLPILAVSTTFGTAAEVAINYIITDEASHRRFVCVDPYDIPIAAFIDSDMTMGMPKKLAASTGVDAMAHAIEGLIIKGAWKITDMLHLKTIEIIGRSLGAPIEGDQSGREKMTLGQYTVGMGFSNVGLELMHGVAHPLSVWCNIPHGIACAALLPAATKYNKEYAGEECREIALVLGIKGAAEMSLENVRDTACGEIDRLSKAVGVPATISELSVEETDVPTIAEDALRDVYTPENPRETTVEETIALYQSLT